jgi:nitroreductase
MKLNNETIKTQLSHRTVRSLKDDPVPQEMFDVLMEVARRTPTSNGMQSMSIISVTDPIIREKIAEVSTQHYIAKAPILLIFVVDSFRNYKIAQENDCHEASAADMDRFIQGFTDGCLAAQNVVVAAESMGLGTNYFGSVLNDPKKLCDILKLPKLVFPIVGLGIGFANQEPNRKPRFDNELRVFENEYNVFDNYMEKLADYDQEMSEYVDLRFPDKTLPPFSKQVVSKLVNVIERRQHVIQDIKDQGFDLKL